jgi:hypothetical protein
MSEENVALALEAIENDVTTDEGLLLAMSWLADGLMADAMPEVALAAFVGLAELAKQRGLVR